MPNLQDYIRWRGDLTLTERPFNVIDNMILAAVSNIDLHDIVPTVAEGGSVSVAEAAGRLEALGRTTVDRRLAWVPPTLLTDMAASARFSDARLRAFTDVIDTESGVQFSAVTIDLPDASTYVAFQGTDNTITGWKEDFAMSFERMGSQTLAVAYLRDRLADSPGRILVGGHSKGGNLALYAAMGLTADEQERVAHVYSNDGPGMAPAVADAESLARLASKTTKIIPSFAVIGRLFDADPVQYTVASTAPGILSHDIMSWQVEGTHLVEAPESPQARVLTGALDDFLDHADDQDRSAFTESLFGALSQGGATLVQDVADPRHGGFEAVALSLLASRKRTAHPVKLFAQAGARALSSINFHDLLVSTSSIHGIVIAVLGLLLAIVPTAALGVIAPLTLVALTGYLVFRLARYVVWRTRREDAIPWGLGVLGVLLLVALVIVLSTMGEWAVPENIALGATMLVNAWVSGNHGLATIRARRPWWWSVLLLVEALVSAVLGVIALSTIGRLVTAGFVVGTGCTLLVCGVVELFVLVGTQVWLESRTAARTLGWSDSFRV